jgi:Tfp pilus assembly protein PilN
VSTVNLLPPELRQRQAIRRTTSLVVVGALGVIALLGIFYFFQMQRLSGAQDDLAAQQAQNAQLRSQIDQLRPFANLQTELANKKALVTQLYQNEVSWSGALLDISRVIPDASYLTNVSGSLTATTQAAGAPVPPPTPGQPTVSGSLIGNITFQGVADQTQTISTWLTRLEQVSGWVNAWVQSAQEEGSRTRIYQFSSGIDLTKDAATQRGRGEATDLMGATGVTGATGAIGSTGATGASGKTP